MQDVRLAGRLVTHDAAPRCAPVAHPNPDAVRDQHNYTTNSYCAARFFSDGPCTIAEPRAKEKVCVRDKTLLERDGRELRAVERRAEAHADAMCEREVQSGISSISSRVYMGEGLNSSRAIT